MQMIEIMKLEIDSVRFELCDFIVFMGMERKNVAFKSHILRQRNAYMLGQLQ
jgi:hypothetical protein